MQRRITGSVHEGAALTGAAAAQLRAWGEAKGSSCLGALAARCRAEENGLEAALQETLMQMAALVRPQTLKPSLTCPRAGAAAETGDADADGRPSALAVAPSVIRLPMGWRCCQHRGAAAAAQPAAGVAAGPSRRARVAPAAEQAVHFCKAA